MEFPTSPDSHPDDLPEVVNLDASMPSRKRRRSSLLAVAASTVGVCALMVGLVLSSHGHVPDTAVPAPESSTQAALLGHVGDAEPFTPQRAASIGQTFDPFSAETPEVVQGKASGAPSAVPLPTAPATIITEAVDKVGSAHADDLLTRPVNGRATSAFGMRFHPVLHYWKLHTGQDWAASCGTPVGAARAGTVVSAGWAGGNGVQVKIDHGMTRGYRLVTTYNHLSSIGVRVGQRVDALDGIGRVGNTGYSTGCHLHFEVIVNGQFTDPLPWLNGEASIVDLSDMQYTTVPTPSASRTAGESAKPSSKPTATKPGASPTATKPGSTPTGAPTPTKTQKPTASPTKTKTSTNTPTAKPTNSATVSPTPSSPQPSSPTPSEPASPSPSSSLSPSDEPEPSASESIEPDESAEPVPSPDQP